MTTFSDQLKEAAEPHWSAAVQHRFVTELFNSTITDSRMARYLVQDYQFCDAFVALLGQAVASAPSLPSRLGHARQLGEFATDENDYFATAFDLLGVSDQDRTAPVRSGVTQDFIDLMLRVRDSRSYPHILVILVVAEWLYLEWAGAGLALPSRPEHLGWIEVHNKATFTTWVDWLRNELNSVEPANQVQRTELEELFIEATRLERAFFDAVYMD